MENMNLTILETDYQMPNIDEKTIEGILKHPQFFRGHVRTAMGKIYTNDEFEQRSNEVLSRELP